MKNRNKKWLYLTAGLILLLSAAAWYCVTTLSCFYPKVFAFHGVIEPPNAEATQWDISADLFERQLYALEEKGYVYGFPEDYRPLHSKTAIVTFDDGYENNYTIAYPIIKKHKAKMTVFLSTGLIDQPGHLTTRQIQEMQDSGLVSFQSHNEVHTDLTQVSSELLAQQMQQSADTIKTITGQTPTAFAYPYGIYNVRTEASARGVYKMAFTAWRRFRTSPYSVPRIPVNAGTTLEDFIKML